MQVVYNMAAANNIINEQSSLADFYNFTDKLSKTRFVRFTGKNDEADNIEWKFTYRGRKLTIQYSIYNGVSLFSEKVKDLKIVTKLADKLHLKTL